MRGRSRSQAALILTQCTNASLMRTSEHSSHARGRARPESKSECVFRGGSILPSPYATPLTLTLLGEARKLRGSPLTHPTCAGGFPGSLASRFALCGRIWAAGGDVCGAESHARGLGYQR